MASSRRSTHSQNEAAEPFPAFSGQDEHTTSVTTSTTTQTIIGGDGDPEIHHSTTAAHPTGQTPSAVYTTNDPNTAPIPFSRTTVQVPSQPQAPAYNVIRRRPIGIRRLPSTQNNRLSAASSDDGVGRSNSGRRRAASAPQDPHHGLTRQSTRQSALPPLQEESGQNSRVPGQAVDDAPPVVATTVAGVGRRRSISNAARSIRSRFSADDESTRLHDDYEDEVVDLLDVIGRCFAKRNRARTDKLPDPEVQTLTTLTNVQNSLFVPDLGRWLNRRPTYTLTRAPSRISEGETPGVTPTPTKDLRPVAPTIEEEAVTEQPTVQRTWSWQRQPRPERSHSISSVLTESHYAVLPHGVTLDDWPEEDKEALDDHVRHMLHSRRSKFKQRMRAFGKYVSKRKPLEIVLSCTLTNL